MIRSLNRPPNILIFFVIAFLASASYVSGGGGERASSSGSGRMTKNDAAFQSKGGGTQDVPTEIRLTFANELPFEREAEPVTCGLPLVSGFASRAHELTLLGPNGRAVPVQILTTSTYKDGTPRWVLLDFQADVPANGKAIYRLTRSQRAPVHKKLTFKLAGGVAKIDTGAAQFRIETSRFRLFDSVTVPGSELLTGGPNSGAVLEEENGSKHRGDLKTTKAEFEDAGPMAVVLTVRGQIRPGGKLPHG